MEKPREVLQVSLKPHEVLAQILTEVQDSYWFDILNSCFARKRFVGFLGVERSTIWVNGFARSANRPQLNVRVEETAYGSLVEYEIKYSLLGGILIRSDEDIPILKALLPRVLDNVRIKPKPCAPPDDPPMNPVLKPEET